MAIETALYPNQLNAAWPPQSDIVREGAGHLRLLKTVIKTTFPNVVGAVSASQIELNYSVGVTSGIQAQINTKGAITGQTWTGAHTFNGTNVLSAATTIGAVTPTEITYLSGVTSAIQPQFSTKANLNGATYTGTHDFSSATGVSLPSNSSIGSVSSAEIAFVDGVTAPIQSQLNGKADITGESYTGTHDFTGGALKAPTATAGTATTDVATTAFVASAALATALPGQTGNAGKFVTTDGTTATWRFPVLADRPVIGTSVAAAAGDLCVLNNVAATTVTLPPSPANDDLIGIYAANRLETNIVNGNGNNVCGLAEVMTIDNPYFPVLLRFRTGLGWDLA